MSAITDKDGHLLNIGDGVCVDDPTESDIWEHSFYGSIKAFKDENTAIVVDGDDDCFDVDVTSLTYDDCNNV